MTSNPPFDRAVVTRRTKRNRSMSIRHSFSICPAQTISRLSPIVHSPLRYHVISLRCSCTIIADPMKLFHQLPRLEELSVYQIDFSVLAGQLSDFLPATIKYFKLTRAINSTCRRADHSCRVNTRLSSHSHHRIRDRSDE